MNAPKVTPEMVQQAIVDTTYTLLPNGRTTVCQLTLDNGFTVEGQSACVCRENYDRAIGEKLALDNATEKVWSLLGFRLADRLKNAQPRVKLRLDADGKVAGMTGELTPRERALDEVREIAVRLTNLDQFVTGNSSFHGLPRIQQELMIKQREVMQSYLSILAARASMM